MSDNQSNSKRIAKNTLLLYGRMLLMMIISLYTSRVVLNALGVEDYGIYNVVGGVVGMSSIFSGSISAAIGRFITFELGKGVLINLGRYLYLQLMFNSPLLKLLRYYSKRLAYGSLITRW